MGIHEGEYSIDTPPAAARVVQRLEGGTTANVHLMEGIDGRRFVRKTATSQTDIALLRGQVQQMAAVIHAGAPANLYPEILAEHAEGFDMEYIPPFAIAGSASPQGFDDRIMEHYFSTQSGLPVIRAGAESMVSGHLVKQAAQRCGRWFDSPTSSAEMAWAEEWLETAKEVDTIIGPPCLHIATHGDFRPENVIPLFAEPMKVVRYVDVRGKGLVWSDGIPYWDPAMDVCSFIMSHYIKTGHKNRTRWHSPPDPEDLLLSITRAMSRFERDSTFFRRLLFYFAIKCVGFAWVVKNHRTLADIRGFDNLLRHLKALEPVRSYLTSEGEAWAIAVLCDRLRQG